MVYILIFTIKTNNYVFKNSIGLMLVNNTTKKTILMLFFLLNNKQIILSVS